MYLYKNDRPRNEKKKNTGSLVRAERYNFGMKLKRNKATYYVFDWVGSWNLTVIPVWLAVANKNRLFNMHTGIDPSLSLFLLQTRF